jgi:hypothetical protein
MLKNATVKLVLEFYDDDDDEDDDETCICVLGEEGFSSIREHKQSLQTKPVTSVQT